MWYAIIILSVICVTLAYYLVKVSSALLDMRKLLIKALNSAEKVAKDIEAQADSAAPNIDSANKALSKISSRAYKARVTFNALKGGA